MAKRTSLIREQVLDMVEAYTDESTTQQERDNEQDQEIHRLKVTCATLESENESLRSLQTQQQRRIILAEEKLEQVLEVLNGTAFRSVLEKEEKKQQEASGNTTGTITNKLRGFVSLKKYRFQKDGFDLDLSYITPQIIAMGYPTEGVEAVYRNPMPEAQRFFETYHSGNYRIYNLCAEPNRQYDSAKFNDQVAVYPFMDHNACALTLFRPFCEDLHAWISADPKRVAAVHCKAGKGRTGTMICAYLLHSGISETSNEALQTFGAARTMNGKGVTIPSQRRFVNYYGQLLHSGFSLPAYMYTVNKIILSPVPNFHYSALGGGCTPCFHVYRVDQQQHKIFDSTEHIRSKRFKAYDGIVEFKNLNVLDCNIGGTIKFQFFHELSSGKLSKIFHFWINTAFVPANGSIVLTKKELDNANKDNRFPENFTMELFLEKEDETPLTDPEYLLDAQGSAYQMSLVQDYIATMSANREKGGSHSVQYRYAEDEWSDDEQEMFAEAGIDDDDKASDKVQTRSTSPSIAPQWLKPAKATPAPAMVEEKMVVVKEGWLNKKGGSRRNWKKRWFVLQVLGEGRDTLVVLSYYESPGAQEPKGSIPLDGSVARSITNSAMQQRHSYSFEITHPDRRTFYLEPHNRVQSEAAEWINAINQVSKSGQTKSRTTTADATMTTF